MWCGNENETFDDFNIISEKAHIARQSLQSQVVSTLDFTEKKLHYQF